MRISNFKFQISKSRYVLLVTLLLLVTGYALLVTPAFAQVDTGLNEITNETGLGTTDIRVTVGRIINVFLGLLGAIAVILILAGGFLWMTAGGNEEKIAKAKQLLLNAAIGLAIILTAFGITTFILRALVGATGGRGGMVTAPSDDTGGWGGRLPRDAFTVRAVQPQDFQKIRNLSVRLFFTRPVDPATAEVRTIIVTNTATNTGVVGTITTEGNVVTFIPTSPCPAPNDSRKCFDASTTYRVEANRSLKSADGKDLVCGLGSMCKATFTTGTLVDTAPPIVNFTNPGEGDYVSADAIVPIAFTAKDDGGIAYVALEVDGARVDTATPPAMTPPGWESTFAWDTTGKANGSAFTLKARAFDVDDNQAESPSLTLRVRAAHCFNKSRDADEIDADCGGKDCGACAGGQCTKNEDCATGACSGGKCVDYPTITRATPITGAPGTLVTIFGRGFGTEPGKVTFLGGIDPNDDKEAHPPAACGTDGMWFNDRIIVAAPEGVVAGPIKVANKEGFYDDTANTRGAKYQFAPSTDVLPGLCRVTPSEGSFGAGLTVTGVNLGDTPGRFTLGGSPVGGTLTWSATAIRGGTVPNVAAGGAEVIITQGSAQSNPLSFQVKEIVGAPKLLVLEPSDGSPGTYLVLRGEHFGSTGTVHFVDKATGTKDVLANITFPPACSAAYWKDTTVTVKAPNVERGEYDVRVVSENTLESNSLPFTVNQRALAPGICRIDPDNGPAGMGIAVSGERFGATRGKVIFAPEKVGVVRTWNANTVEANVPLGALTGPVRLVDSDQTRSNTLSFTVRDCRSGGSCGTGNECCGDGSCRASGTCIATGIACTLGWRFTTGTTGGGGVDSPCAENADCKEGLRCNPATNTCVTNGDLNDPCKKNADCKEGLRCDPATNTCTNGEDRGGPCQENRDCKEGLRCDPATNTCTDGNDIGGPCQNHRDCKEGLRCDPATNSCVEAIPSVVEDTSCADQTQSPSPYRDTQDACTNAQIAARFSLDMDDDSLGSRNVVLEQCNAGSGSFDATRCTALPSVLFEDFIAHDTAGEGAVYKPAQALAASTWHRVTLKGAVDGGIKSSRGVSLGADYVWTFRTGSGSCRVDHVEVTPRTATIIDPSGVQEYTAFPTSVNCNLLSPGAYTWQWTSSDTAKALVAGSTTNATSARPNAATARAKQETKGTPIVITGTIPSEQKGDAGDLSIAYRDLPPRIVAQWPQCRSACTNTEIGAQFGSELDVATLAEANAIQLFACQPPDQVTATALSLVATAGRDARAKGMAAIDAGNAAIAVGDVVPVGGAVSTPIPQAQITAARTAATTARAAATAVRAAATAAQGLIDALAAAATTTEKGRQTDIANSATTAEAKASEAEAASQRNSAEDAGGAGKLGGEAVKRAGEAALTLSGAAGARIAECTREKIVQPSLAVDGIGYNRMTSTLRFFAKALVPETSYRVLLSPSIAGKNGKPLDPGAMSFTLADNGPAYASWIFRTKEPLATCAIGRAEVEPADAIAPTLGFTVPYSAVARGSPDSCNASGQRLDPRAYTWQWGSTDPSVATVTNVAGAPEQRALAAKKGKTTIEAAAAGKKGEGLLTVDGACGGDRQCGAGYVCNQATQECERDPIPHVVQDPFCAINTQSPSPYRDSTNACTAGVFGVRFTRNMRDDTLTNTANALVAQCNTNGPFDDTKCATARTIVHNGWLAHDDPNGEGAQYALANSEQFIADTWYRVTLKGNKIASKEGQLLDGGRDYVWSFRTAGSPCALDRVLVTPPTATISDPLERREFSAVPLAANCNILNANTLTWQWASGAATKAAVAPLGPGPTTTATPLAETGATPVAIKTESGGKRNASDLFIAYPSPRLERFWPSCDAACSNISIGAVFSSDVVIVQAGGVDPSGLYACRTDACPRSELVPTAMQPLLSIDYTESTRTLMVVPDTLRADTRWRVVLSGAKVRGRNGKALANLNFDTDGDGKSDAFAWTFKTKGAPATCAIDRVAVEPANYTVYAVGTQTPYTSVAQGRPDACDPNGQRLNSLAYNWAWDSSATNVGTLPSPLFNLMPAPPRGPDGNTDPKQDVTGVAEGETDITATTETRNGKGKFSVVCGFSQDSQCQSGFGVDGQGCCASRPSLTRSVPSRVPKQTDVCRNALLEAEFSERMDDTSFTGNVTLVKKDAGNETQVAAAFEVKVVQDPATQTSHSLLTFTPTNLLDATAEYEWRIRGTGQQEERVRSTRGVSLPGDVVIPFATQATVCTFASAEVLRRGAGIAEDLFTCAKQSGCTDDDDAVASGNQHKYDAIVWSADTPPQRLALAGATAEWLERIPDPATFAVGQKQPTSAVVTAEPKNGNGEVTFSATGGRGEGTVAKTVRITNFICENPWPSVSHFPWTDQEYNFSVFYCRDAGPAGPDGDLPPLHDPSAIRNPSEPGLLKEFIMPVKQ